ncbi:PINIT domain-containing protein [Xylaria bambusicola]|uniref:PINIT domain-containing protein n=1 Tax=Xylaria bambusicola TaxID=326684 RepID=UPI00200834D0|nr:PINIT domain-containing protein [Xylaria bambusicola]KAI0512689.1 PINIT domain-containing protein [Xylaria bambusicola]
MIALIENYTAAPYNFRKIQESINNIVRGSSGPTPQQNMANPFPNGNYNYPPGRASDYASQTHRYPGASNSTQSQGSYGSSTAGGNTLSYYRNAHQNMRDLQFKPSPFYSIISRIGDIRTCDIMSQHRSTVVIPVRVGDHPNLVNLSSDKSYRVMVFCAGDRDNVQDIAFPHQSEFKVNGGDIKANLRGLKGKPGTTRPVDVTSALRLKPATYNNTIEFTYALTNKVKKHDLPPATTKFYLAAYLCKMVTVDELVTKIRGRKIAKATVIQEINKKANDPDVVATSTVLSLKCPLSYARLSTPCRSVLCQHIQCFDAASYLQLQEQGPQWLCPICNQAAPFENLAVDEYVRDILENTADATEQVTIEPDGRWSAQKTETVPKKSRHSNAKTSIDVEDDVSVVTDNLSHSNGYGSTPHPYATPIRTFMSGETPGPSSREPSGAPRSGGTKRPAPEVIDLTLDSDEDDAPLFRPTKKARGSYDM